MPDDLIDEAVSRGYEFFNKGDWHGAQNCFLEAVFHPMPMGYGFTILEKVVLTLLHERRVEEGLAITGRVKRLISKSDYGCTNAGQITRNDFSLLEMRLKNESSNSLPGPPGRPIITKLKSVFDRWEEAIYSGPDKTVIFFINKYGTNGGFLTAVVCFVLAYRGIIPLGAVSSDSRLIRAFGVGLLGLLIGTFIGRNVGEFVDRKR